MDHAIAHVLNTFLTHHDAIEDPLGQYAKWSEILFAAVLGLVVAGAARRRSPELLATALAAGSSMVIALALGAGISAVVNRPRPFMTDHAVHLFSAHPADAGFPSDHATAAFAIAMAIWLRHRVFGTVLLVAAAALAVDRVALGLHWPTDVIAGTVLGSCVATAVHAAHPARRAIGRVAALAGPRGRAAAV